MTKGIVMPGCGAQYIGMGKELYDNYRVVQEYFEEASDCLSINFVKLCFASSDLEISSLEYGPLTLFVIETASAALLREDGIAYDAIAGVDMVSWYSALHAAQGISFPDGLYMLRKWIEYVGKCRPAGRYGTVQIDGSNPATDAMIQSLCERAHENGYALRIILINPETIIVAGDSPALLYLEEVLKREKIAHEQHDEYLDCFAALTSEEVTELNQYFGKIDIKEPLCQLVDPFGLNYITTKEEVDHTIRELFSKPVRADRVFIAINRWKRALCTVPSPLIIRETYSRIAPETAWVYMETVEEYTVLRERY